MRHYHAVTLVFSFLTIPLFHGLSHAQTDRDVASLMDKEWSTKILKEGVVWHEGHFDTLFDSRQAINFIRIDLRDSTNHIAFAGLSNGLELTSAFAEGQTALAAINATFFDMKNGGSVTYLKIDGKVINHTTLLDNRGFNHERANGALVIDGRQFSIVRGDSSIKNWDEQLTAPNVMVCGPVLLLDGEEVLLNAGAFNDNRHPRSAVAITADHHLLLLTVDGRNARAQGVSLRELGFILKMLGASDALNLDGGGSTTLYVRGESETGVVNYPSDNKLFDHGGERKVANAILVF